MRFTDRSIQALRPKAQRYEVFEDGRNGFGLRVTPRGTRTFIYIFTNVDGRRRRMTLGQYPAMTLAEAREAHGVAMRRVEKGEDPADDKVQANVAHSKAETVGELIDLYIEDYAKKRKRSWAEDKRQLEKDVRPEIGSMKVTRVGRKEINRCLDRVRNRGSKTATNRLLAVMRRMFRIAVSREIIDINPVRDIERPFPEQKRTRFLEEAHIPDFWHGLEKAEDISPAIRLAARLILVTGQRRAEAAGAAKSEFDLKAGLWTIPGERTKNGKTHVVPLSNLAKQIVREAIALSDDECDWVFPSRNKKQPITPHAITRALGRNKETLGRLISPHDLRRTFSTIAAGPKVGAPRFVRDRILNHTDQTVGSHYDLYEYLTEKRDVMNKWGNHLSRLIRQKKSDRADNVVDLENLRVETA